MNVAAVWTNNSGGTASPPDDDCERVRTASAEISIKRIFGSPKSRIIKATFHGFRDVFCLPCPDDT
jgi:hypothetical protein